MNISRWKGKIAVVTGASAGIGAAIAVELAKQGLITYGLARRAERVEALKERLSTVERRNLLALKCDVSDEKSIIETFAKIEKLHGGVDVLVNNAGVIHEGSTLDPNNSDIMRSVIDTNVMGLVFCTREAFKSMKARKCDGHIIHINSIGGHKVPVHLDYPSFGVYGASKYAVTALTEQHRQDIIREKMNVKVSSLSPGAVRTELVTNESDKLNDQLANVPLLDPKDIADAVVYLLSTPQNVEIHELTIKPKNELF